MADTNPQDVGSIPKGGLPPLINTSGDFQHWKLRFKNFITYSDPELWYSYVDETFIPETIPSADRYKYKTMPVSIRGLTGEDLRRVKMDLKAYATLTLALPIEVIMCVQDFETAKSLWDQLELMFGGTEERKQMKIDKLKYQFDTFSHMPGESVTQQLQRFVQLVNELKKYQIKYDTYDMNKKLFHTLPESWKHNVGLIKNTKDITKVKIEDMIAKVEAMAMDESTRNNSSLKIDQYRFSKNSNGVKALVTDLDYQVTDGESGNELSLVVASPAPHSSGFTANYSSSNQGRSDSQFHHCNHSSSGSRSTLDTLNDEQKALCHAFLSSYNCLLAGTLTFTNITGTDLE